MKPQDSLTVNILEKEYRVACPTHEKDGLKASARLLNKRLQDIKKSGAVLGTERIAVMAALNLSHEVVTGKQIKDEHSALDARITKLSERIESSIRQIKLI
jgi:cell division protein ZapA